MNYFKRLQFVLGAAIMAAVALPAGKAFAFIGAVVGLMARLERGELHRARELEIHQGDVRVGADEQGAFVRTQSEDPRSV